MRKILPITFGLLVVFGMLLATAPVTAADYYNPSKITGNVTKVTFKSIPDNAARLTALQAGEIDIMDGVQPADYGTITDDADLNLLDNAGMNVGYMAMNCMKAPFNDSTVIADPDYTGTNTTAGVLVRRAFNYAINVTDINAVVHEGAAYDGVNGMPPTIPFYDTSLSPYGYDKGKALDLLELAGYDTSEASILDLTLWYMPVSRPYFPDAASVATMIQSDLAEINVTVTLFTEDWSPYLEHTEDGDHEMCLLGWSADYADADNFLYVLLSGHNAVAPAGNVAFYNSTYVTDKLDTGREETATATREAAYKDAQKQIYKDSPWVVVDYSKNAYGVAKTVEGFVGHPTGPGMSRFWETSITGGSLVYGRGGDTVTLDPADITDGESWKVASNIYETLYEMPIDSATPQPCLAESFSLSTDKKEWTFTLRDDVYFHNGDLFTANDVVFTFERMENCYLNTSDYFTNNWVPAESGYYDWILRGLLDSVTAIDNTTVKFTLNTVFAPFLAAISIGPFSIVSETYVKANNDITLDGHFSKFAIGTGPMKFVEWIEAATITLESATAAAVPTFGFGVPLALIAIGGAGVVVLVSRKRQD